MRIAIAFLLLPFFADAQIVRAWPFYTAPEEAATTLLLDDYPCSGAAYSFRKLRTAYTGNCIRVRRQSDNAESNIGFIGNYLDTTALKTFIGSDTARLVTWYDQSTGGRNASMSTANQQPFIAFGGNINYHGGEVAAKNTASGSLASAIFHMQLSSFTHNSIYTVAKADAINIVNYVTYGNSGILYGGTFAGITGIGFFTGSSFVGSSTEDTNEHLAHVHVNSSNDGFFLDGLRITSSSIATGTTSQIMGRSGSNEYPIIGQVKEIIIYANDQLANDTGIANNINAFYSIY